MENSTRIRIISLRSSPSSSRIRLLASTTSAGSMNTVFPLADSSCTIPFIFRFNPGATGITRRPSRIVGVTSLSTTPSDWALRRIPFNEREILFMVFVNSRRIRASSDEALSFIFPYGESILFIFWINCGNARISLARFRRQG